MLFVYIETDQSGPQEIHEVCLGTSELDENPFVVAVSVDIVRANSEAQRLANKLREGGAKVKLH